jgi:phenylacetate-CoA ligase
MSAALAKAAFALHLARQFARSARHGGAANDARLSRRARALAHILKVAAARSVYYRRALAGIDPQCADPLSAVPLLDRQTLVERFDDIVTVPGICARELDTYFKLPFDFSRRLRGEFLAFHTSGSSGKPAYLMWGAREFGISTGAFLYHATSRLGGVLAPRRRRRWRVAYIGILDDYVGGNSWVHAMRGIARVGMFSAFEPMTGLCSQLERFDPDILISKPTILGEVARRRARGEVRLQPSAVFFAGENIAPQDRSDIRASFDVRPYNSYSMCEIGPIALEHVSDDDVLSVYDELVHIELFDDDGRPIRDYYRPGNIVATNLYNTTMPVLRYKTGDRAYFVPRDGSTLGTCLSYIQGRNTKTFTFRTADGKRIRVPEYPFWSLHVTGVSRYQVHQVAPDRLLIRVQWLPGFDARGDAMRAISSKLNRIVEPHGAGAALAVSFEDVAEILPLRSGKIQITHPLESLES